MTAIRSGRRRGAVAWGSTELLAHFCGSRCRLQMGLAVLALHHADGPSLKVHRSTLGGQEKRIRVLCQNVSLSFNHRTKQDTYVKLPRSWSLVRVLHQATCNHFFED